MKIVMVHNYYQVRGGEDESFESESRILREAGHEVSTYTQHNDQVQIMGAVRTGFNSVWSRDAYWKIRSLLKRVRPDILHVQNFFPLLSPSVYYGARAEGVPVVQSLRNYRLICPNGLLFRDQHICEACTNKAIPYPGILHACYRGSYLATASVGAMLALHRLVGTWTNMVDVYVALTNFALRQFVRAGLPEERIVVKGNFVHPDPGVGQHSEKYALYVGRLTPEKGLLTVLRAWKELGGTISLKIVGEGPLSSEVERFVKANPGVEWLGRRPVQEVYRLMGDCFALVLPSEWHEPFGRVAVEAYATGTPVIASSIGAMPELVADGRTGLLFEPGNAADLAQKLRYLLESPVSLRGMRDAARQEYVTKFTAESNYRQLMDIYDLARKRHAVRG